MNLVLIQMKIQNWHLLYVFQWKKTVLVKPEKKLVLVRWTHLLPSLELHRQVALKWTIKLICSYYEIIVFYGSLVIYEMRNNFLAPAPEDEAMLARALEMSMEPADSKSTKTTGAASEPNLAAMTEEEQIEYAMRMSMQVAYLYILSF